MERNKPRFDFVNFVYGIGAAIVIIGAIAKFLDWNYADEMFIGGLATEAVVFIISSFRFNKPGKDYKWEKVFPGIIEDSEESIEVFEKGGMNNESLQRNTEMLENKMRQMEENLTKFNEVFSQLTRSVEGMNTSIKKLEDANMGYEGQMKELKRNLNNINNFYNDFSEVMIYKKKDGEKESRN